MNYIDKSGLYLIDVKNYENLKSDDCLLCKFGLSKNCDIRFSQHKHKYGSNIEMIGCINVPEHLLLLFEKKLYDYFTEMKVDYESERELVLIPNNKLQEVLNHYLTLRNELYSESVLTSNELSKELQKIKISTTSHENELQKIKSSIISHENEKAKLINEIKNTNNHNIINKIFKCEYCDYSTKSSFNFNRHNTRKNPCHKYKPNKDINIPEKTTDIVLNNFECICGKIMKNKYNYQKHKNTCKGVNSLTCPYCKIKFNNAKSKHYHLKKGKCKMSDEQKAFNNDEYTENIKNFGEENLDHIYNDPNFINNMLNLTKDKSNVLIDCLNLIYFDPEHPENQTIKKYNKKDGFIKIHKNNNFVPRPIHPVLERINSKIEDLFEPFFKHIVDEYDLKNNECPISKLIKDFCDLLVIHDLNCSIIDEKIKLNEYANNAWKRKQQRDLMRCQSEQIYQNTKNL